MAVKAIFLQISDLHIGDIEAATGNATLSHALAKAAATYSRFDGLLGHHARGLEDLAAFCKQLRKSAPADCVFRVVLTGDVTRCGGASEFDVAEQYLFGEVEVRPGVRVGLKLSRDEVIGIPGNHDHWGGANFPLSRKKSVYASRGFAATPYLQSVVVGPRVVTFAGINSDCDVDSLSPSRFWAWGSFMSELNSANLVMPPRPPNEVRMCLIHHSWAANGWSLSMSGSSKQAFKAFLTNNSFHGMLSGHMHMFLVPKHGSPAPHGFEEFRCGSTTQHDIVPYNWTTLLGNRRPKKNWLPNALTVHKLDTAPGLSTWESETFVRIPHAGFKSHGAQHAFSFPV